MDFKFPDVGEGIHEGVIVKWRVKTGDHVKRDQVLCEVETDKAIVEIPSPEDGVIGTLYHKEGETVHVGEVLVSYEKEGSATSTPSEKTPQKKAEKKEEVKDQGGVVGAIIDADSLPKTANQGPLFDALKKHETHPADPKAQVSVLPALRKLAEELQVDLSKITGTGTGGKISKEDIEKAAQSGGTSPVGVSKPDAYGEVEYQKLSQLRKTIAAHLKKTQTEMIPVTQTHYADVTDLNFYRKEVNIKWESKGYKFTFLPFICMALIKTLQEFPTFNAEYKGDTEELVLKKYVNIGIAVDTDHGLFVPVVQQAEKKNIQEISQMINELASQVKDRSIHREKLMGASITITNYGSVGTVFATPIINHPNTCILGLGAIQNNLKMKEGKIEERMILPLTLTYDHRFIDGADCARFLNKLTQELENKLEFEYGLL